jgi:2',3'-cyclic-nucleotide 2'-phosphodiesterase/3'-nucleotidase
LTLFDFDLVWSQGRWTVERVGSSVLNSNTVPEDPKITDLLAAEHRKVVAYVNQVIGTSKAAMDTSEGPYKDVPLIDLINQVQVDTVRAALAGGQYADLPVLSQASCFSRTAKVAAGDVTIKDAAGLYPFDNTLEARLITGAQVREYLEYSAKYYVQTAPDAPVDPAKLTNAENTPDYNYDVVSGLTYTIDIAQPVGSRIKDLRFQGEPLDDGAQFVFAVNNYRAGGGGNFPHVPNAQQVWANSDEIRNTMIAWVQAKGALDPADFFTVDWRLTRDGVPVFDDTETAAGAATKAAVR